MTYREKFPEHWIGNSFHFVWCEKAAFFGFGKHYGKDISFVKRTSPEYLQWLSNDFSKPSHVRLIAAQALTLNCKELKKWLKESFWQPRRK